MERSFNGWKSMTVDRCSNFIRSEPISSSAHHRLCKQYRWRKQSVNQDCDELDRSFVFEDSFFAKKFCLLTKYPSRSSVLTDPLNAARRGAGWIGQYREGPNGSKGGSLYEEGCMMNGAPPDQQRPQSVGWHVARSMSHDTSRGCSL
jgi:hypothetical protein